MQGGTETFLLKNCRQLCKEWGPDEESLRYVYKQISGYRQKDRQKDRQTDR